jgi:alkyl sulfatase BDS1-like metallo-beta-lactamase superfamily hydrolase
MDLPAPKSATKDVISATPLDMFFDLLAVRLIGPKAEDKIMTLNINLTDIEDQYVLTVENGVLNYAEGKQADQPDATLTTTRVALDQVLLGEASLADKLATGEANIVGSQEKLIDFLSLMDNFEFWFNIVTP